MDICNMHYRRLRKNGTMDKVRVRKFCTLEGCDSPAYGNGLCRLHWKRMRRNGTTEIVNVVKFCTIDGCDKPRVGGGLCSAHYTRKVRTGDPLTRRQGEVVDGKRICPKCEVDTPISGFGDGQRYCRPCTRLRAREWIAKNPRPQKVLGYKNCDHCGKEFAYNGKQWINCSMDCFWANKNRRNAKHHHRRRARLRNAFVEDVDRKEIYERDGWICQLCGKPIPKDAVWPDPLYPSLDHIIPLARGGMHSRANSQAAHFRCNNIKGAKLPR